MFIAAQVISDFEELWQNPFGEISTIFPGSGAAWFLGAYRRGLPPTERKNEVTTDTKICRNIVSELQQRSSLEMECFGCYIDDDGRVRNKLNDRLICAHDGEHMSCKGAIRINCTFAAYRISRRISPAQPSFHPVRYDPGWPQDVYEIAAAAVKAYITLVEVQRWPVLHDIFLTKLEKNKRDNSASNPICEVDFTNLKKRARDDDIDGDGDMESNGNTNGDCDCDFDNDSECDKEDSTDNNTYDSTDNTTADSSTDVADADADDDDAHTDTDTDTNTYPWAAI
jgi:hypothetical protein